MGKLIDLTGKKFGVLTVIGHACIKRKKNNGTVHYWLCECECGVKKNIAGYSLTQGRTIGCGCLNRQTGKNNPTWKGYEEISSSLFSHIQWSALKRKLEFNLKIEDLWELYLRQGRKCALSGIPISFPKYALDTSHNISLDRIDSSKGYNIDNVQWVEKRINFMKITLGNEEFIELCKAVSKNN